MPIPKNSGIVSIPSHHSADDTVERLKSMFAAKGIQLFAIIDHSGEAAKAGINMPPTKLLIFGNPRAGTPLMLAAPGAAIDLPLKALIAEDGSGNTSISFNSSAYLLARHGFPAELLPNIAGAEALIARAAE